MYAKKIDILKGLLTLQMILAHCIQFYTDLEKNTVALHISEYINLITFSGFMFCFGYASHLAYFSKERRDSSRRLFVNAGKLLASYYLSCFCYVIFVEKLPLRMNTVRELLLLKRLAGWSEFLFSFALVMILELFLFPLFTEKYKWGIVIMGCIVLLFCFLPYREVGSIRGSLIGGYGGAYFPVIPYSVYLLTGVWLARTQTGFKKGIFMISLAGTIWYMIDYRWISVGQPSRFPLSFSFLVGAAFFLYLYYLFSIMLEKRKENIFIRYLAKAGKNSLFYLLVSNLIIFSISSTKFYRINILYSIILWLIILLLIDFLKSMIRDNRKNQADMLE